jgi:hypothetical protein
MKKTMIKLATILCLFFAVSFSTQAQLYERGEKVADAGLFFPSGSTVVKAGLTFGVADNVGAGLEANYSSSSDSYYYSSSSSFGLYGKVNYDFAPALDFGTDKVFTYIGGGIGKEFETGSSVYGAGQIGAGYMVNDRVGFNLEVRFGIVNARGAQFGIGVVFKLR